MTRLDGQRQHPAARRRRRFGPPVWRFALRKPHSWSQDADHVADQLADAGRAVAVVAGSNGCSTAARLAVAHPDLVERIALCWPVTVHHGRAHERSLAVRIAEAAGQRVSDGLLAGETLRGVLDDELASLVMPTAVMASTPENPVHRQATATTLLGLLAGAAQLAPMPEPPAAGFEPTRFADTIHRWAAAA